MAKFSQNTPFIAVFEDRIICVNPTLILTCFAPRI
jgi:hypothetical protein